MVERKSTFKGDLKSERAVNEFLQKHLYSRLVDKGIIATFNSETTDDQQHNGIDTIVYIFNADKTVNQNGINIDEKTALHYAKTNLNEKSLPTFAFEVSYLKYGKLKIGWLTNEKYDGTKVYFLCWLWIKANANKYDLNCEDILKIEVMSIHKKTIRDNLISRALGRIDIKSFEENAVVLRKKMRDKGVKRLELERKLEPLINSLADTEEYEGAAQMGIYPEKSNRLSYPQWVLSSSDTLNEAPLNIVVEKEELVDLASSHWVITPNSFIVKKTVSKK